MIYDKNMKPIKSSADNLPSEVYYMVVQGAKMYYSTDYDKVADMVQKINSKPGPRVYGPYTEDDPEEIQELYEVGYLSNSRKPIKSGTSIKEYAGFKIDDSVKINSPKRGPYKNGKTGIVVGFYKRYDGEILISVQLDEGGLMDFSKDELENLGDSGYHITYLDSSRKPIKSANYNGFNLEARRSYGKGNGYFTTYPVWDTDLDTSIGAIEYHYTAKNPYYVAWVYNDFGVNKTGRTKAFDTEEECLEWIGEELASGTTARDKLLKYWEEIGYDYKSKNLNNSRRPVKSDWKREAEFMNDRIRDDNLLYQVFKIEDEHFGGNFENPDNWDGTHIVYTIENGEITNTEIVDSFEDIIDDGNKYYLSANRDTGYRNTDYVLDRVALWQERNNRGITSSRKYIKSSAAPDGLTFDSREDEDGYKFIQYKITDQGRLDKIKGYCDHNEDELQLGKTFLNLMYDESDKLLAAQLVDTDSSTWEVSPEECVEVFGSSIETLSDPSVDKQGVTSSRKSKKSVKSGLDFVQKGELILAKKGTKVVGYIGQNADKSYYYGLGTPGKSSGVMVVSDFNSAAKRLEEQSRQ